MDSIEPSDPRLPKRPVWGLLMLLMPLVGVAALTVAYAVTWGFGLRGRAATGPAVHLTYAGCAEAGPVLDARLADMGLPFTRAATPDGFAIDATLPADERAAAGIPATLARPGQLEVLGDGERLAGPPDVVDASVRMDLTMTPTLLVRVGPEAAGRVAAWRRAHPTGAVTFRVDGVEVGHQSSQDPMPEGELELSPAGMRDGAARWDAIAAWSVTLDHPLPCPVSGPR